MSTFRSTDGTGLKVTYTVQRGNDIEDTITVFNGIYPVPVGGWHAWFTVKLNYDDPLSSALVAIDWIPTTMEGLAGKLVIRVDKEVTRHFPIGCWSYDLKAINDTGHEITVMAGQFEVEPAPSALDN